jgi:hypothetical protein
MTENTFTEAPPLETEASQSRKPLLILGGVAGAVALGAAGFFLLHGGGSSDNTTAFVPIRHGIVNNVVHPSKTTHAAVKPAVKKLPVVSVARLGRDPFKALYVVPAAAPAGATTPTTTTPGTTTTTPAGSTTSTTSGTTTPTTTATTPYTLQLLTINGPAGTSKTFVFLVGGVRKTVIAAQKFGKYGELVTLNWVKNAKGTPIAAVIQVGDDDPVAIKIGEKLTVQ